MEKIKTEQEYRTYCSMMDEIIAKGNLSQCNWLKNFIINWKFRQNCYWNLHRNFITIQHQKSVT